MAQATVRGAVELAEGLDKLSGDVAGLDPERAAAIVAATVEELERPHRRTGLYLLSVRVGEPIDEVSQVVVGAPYALYVERRRAPLSNAVRIASGDVRDDTEKQINQRIKERFPR